jgi:hypothetical protein
MLVGGGVLGTRLAWCTSPTFNEVGQLPSGLVHLREGYFGVERVNPPLPRLLSAVLAEQFAPHLRLTVLKQSTHSRDELLLGLAFLHDNGPLALQCFTSGRLAGVGAYLCGAIGCWLMARRLTSGSNVSGLLAMALWISCPTCLGNSALVMSDVFAASCAVLTVTSFRYWLDHPTWSATVGVGALLGIAQLTKTTLLLLYPILVVLYVLHVVLPCQVDRRHRPRAGVKLACAFAISIVGLNLGYLCDGTCLPLRTYSFDSEMMRSPCYVTDCELADNRFKQSILGEVLVPLPRDYVLGIDRQRADFEGGFRSYLHGVWKNGGWWYFYLYAMGIKMPLGTLVLLGLAVVLTGLRCEYRCGAIDECCLIVPALAFGAFVSSQDGFSIHWRYVMPALPFIYSWIAKVGMACDYRQRRLALGVLVALVWTGESSVFIYPHCLSYCNELVGGPSNGHMYFVDSPVAWGQDLYFLQGWVHNHPDATPLHLANFGWVHPSLVGIDFELPPVSRRLDRARNLVAAANVASDEGPQPGWYVVDVNFMHGTHWPAARPGGGWRYISPEGPNLEYFRLFKPVAMIGYSYAVFHISADAANNVRRGMGVAALPCGGTLTGRGNEVSATTSRPSICK